MSCICVTFVLNVASKHSAVLLEDVLEVTRGHVAAQITNEQLVVWHLIVLVGLFPLSLCVFCAYVCACLSLWQNVQNKREIRKKMSN